MTDADYWIDKLKLTIESEVGGHLQETSNSNETIDRSCLPERFNGDRGLYSAVYYLLRDREVTALHQLKQDEMWHFYTGKPLAIHLFPADKKNYQIIKLGSNFDAGEVFQAVAPHDTWFGVELLEPNSFALVGTVLSPGYNPADSKNPTPDIKNKLIELYPEQKEIVERLTQKI
jgi:uncharacterized protein